MVDGHYIQNQVKKGKNKILSLKSMFKILKLFIHR